MYEIGGMQNFRKLRVWQLAAQLTLDANAALTPRHCRRLPGFRGQAMRAVQSIEDNIVEGCGKSSPGGMIKWPSSGKRRPETRCHL